MQATNAPVIHRDVRTPIKTLREVRDELANAVLVATLIVGIPVVMVSVLRAVDTGWQHAMFFHIAVILALGVAVLLRRRLPFHVRTAILLGPAFLTGCLGLLAWGLSGNGVVLLVLCSMLAALFYGARGGVVTVGAGLAAMTAVAVGVRLGWLSFGVDFNRYAVAPTSWLLAIVSFVLFTAIVVVATVRVFGSLSDSVAALDRHTAERDRANEELRGEIAERRRAEEELRRSEERFRRIFEEDRTPMFLLSPSQQLIEVNRALCEMLGYTAEELTGRPLADIVHPKLTDGTLNDSGRFLAGEADRVSFPERFFVGKNGALVCVDVEVSLAQSPAGDPLYALVILEHAAERRTETLKASETRYRSVIEDQAELILRFLPDGTRTFVNESYCRYVGKDRKELLGTRFWLEIPDRERPALERNLARLTPENPFTVAEHRRRLPGGTFEWHEWTFRAIFDAEDLLLEIQSVGRDVTERKQAEEERRRAQAHQALILRSLPMAFYTANPDGDYGGTWVSEQIDRVSGFTVEDFLTDPTLWASRLHPEDRDRALEAFDRLADEGTIEVDYRWQTADGKYRWFRDRAVLARDDEGQPREILGFWLDVTDRKRAGDEAERHREELARADKMISLGTLVAGIAHEINNPNAVILLNLEVLSRIWEDVFPILDRWHEEDPELRLANIPYQEVRGEILQLIDDAYRAGERIKLLLAEFGHYVRAERREPAGLVAINDAVTSALTLLGNRIHKSTAHFTVQCGDELPKIRGYVRRLQQVIINLILNACQALTSRDQAVRVTTRYDPAASRVVVTVEDEGKGIAATDLPRITDRFFTTKRIEGGTGLGLAVAARIVEEHGGELTHESELGRGTIARLALPVYR